LGVPRGHGVEKKEGERKQERSKRGGRAPRKDGGGKAGGFVPGETRGHRYEGSKEK